MSALTKPFRFRGGIGHQEQGQYNIPDIMKNLRIDLTGKSYRAVDFVNRMYRKIHKTNQRMQVERVRLPESESLNNNLREEDHVFKYKVTLYGRTWA